MFKITEVRIHLIQNDPRLLAFADVIMDDCFIIHDLKVVRGNDRLFINMPSRRVTDRCYRCNKPNAVMSRFCNWCGAEQGDRRPPRDENGYNKSHFDICHPITRDCRDIIAEAVLGEYDRQINPVPPAPPERLFGYGIEIDEYEERCAYE